LCQDGKYGNLQALWSTPVTVGFHLFLCDRKWKDGRRWTISSTPPSRPKKAVAHLLVRLSPSHKENEITFDNDWWASHEYICYWKWKSLLNLILMSNADGGHQIFVQWQQRVRSLCRRWNIHRETSKLIQHSCFGLQWRTVYLKIDQKLGLQR